MSIEPITKNKNAFIGAISLYLLIAIAFYIFLPGITGNFILDDNPNLSPIGKYQHLDLWSNFWLYLLEGRSGPTGRPISLASFYLNDIAWPSHPASFIYTNILIHLLNGVLLFWFMIKLASSLQLAATQKNILAFTATALWLLHPLHTTTVLYVVQRMTELSATFMFMGFIFYLYGRKKLDHKPKTGFIYLYIGVGTSLLLAMLSKENGILLVAYILVVELFLLRPLQIAAPKYLHFWFVPFIVVPFVFILFYLVYRTWIGTGYNIRDFTVGERLFTEARVIFDYLYHIIIPNIGDSSIFHDDYVISRSLFDPWTTLPAITGIITLLTTSFYFRKKYPLVSFSIIWFFVGHLLESTVLPLELYFEHRNYLPMLGFFIAIGIYITTKIKQYTMVVICSGIFVVSLLVFLTHQNSTLWGKTIELVTNWHNAHPNSIRAQEYYQFYTGDKTKLKISSKQTPYLVMWNIKQSCKNNTITPKKLKTALDTFEHQNIHNVTTNVLKEFIVAWRQHHCDIIGPEHIKEFLNSMLEISIAHDNKHYTYHLYFWLSRFYMYQGDLNNAMINMEKSYAITPDTSLLLIQVGYLSSAGLYKQALEKLEDTKLLETTYKKRLILNLKQPQFDRLRKALTEKIERQKMLSNTAKR